MSIRRTLARLCALPAAFVAVAVIAAAPASAHVTGTPSVANAGAYTVLTMSVPHGCEGSPTTKVEIQIPESVLSVTPTRNPFWDVKTTIAKLDEPQTDAHGNEVTERIGTVAYTAKTPLPDGQRDTFELSFQIPEDAAGDMLAFPTVQTCAKGQTGWTEIPQDAADAEELEHPAPAFEVLPATDGDAAAASGTDTAATAQTAADGEAASADDDGAGSDPLAWAGLIAGVLGLVVGGIALARSRTAV
jgi:uncharacterized protein YcnI